MEIYFDNPNTFIAPLNYSRGTLKLLKGPPERARFSRYTLATKQILFWKPQGIWRTMVNIGIYFDNLNSFMAHINSLRAEMQKDNFFCTSKV